MSARSKDIKPIPWVLAATLLGATLAAPAMADGIGLSVNIGDYPQPQLISRQPIWIERPRGAPMRQPIYLHVPPGHQRNWRRYCGQYNACGQPVLFVRDSWYQRSYVPHYRERHGNEGRDHDQGPRKD